MSSAESCITGFAKFLEEEIARAEVVAVPCVPNGRGAFFLGEQQQIHKMVNVHMPWGIVHYLEVTRYKSLEVHPQPWYVCSLEFFPTEFVFHFRTQLTEKFESLKDAFNSALQLARSYSLCTECRLPIAPAAFVKAMGMCIKCLSQAATAREIESNELCAICHTRNEMLYKTPFQCTHSVDQSTRRRLGGRRGGRQPQPLPDLPRQNALRLAREEFDQVDVGALQIDEPVGLGSRGVEPPGLLQGIDGSELVRDREAAQLCLFQHERVDAQVRPRRPAARP